MARRGNPKWEGVAATSSQTPDQRTVSASAVSCQDKVKKNSDLAEFPAPCGGQRCELTGWSVDDL